MDFITEINGMTLEFYEDGHIYVCDGVIIPSITQILKYKFPHKYGGINKQVLDRASDAGTAVHEAIERYCTDGEDSSMQELRNFKFLMDKYNFKVLRNEIPVILSLDGDPVCAGRVDMVLEMDGRIGGADVKRTSALDKSYLAYQLNLYRIAYKQCYGVEWEFLRGIHLRDDVRKFVPIVIAEDLAMDLLREWRKNNE